MDQERNEKDCPKHGRMMNFCFVKETALGFIRNYWCPYCEHEVDVEIKLRVEPMKKHSAVG